MAWRWLDAENRWLIAATVTATLAMALPGCGHRELKAPCSPSDGAAALTAERIDRTATDALALIPVEDLRPLWPPAQGPLPVRDAKVDPCGPLRPLNSHDPRGASPGLPRQRPSR